MFQVPCIETLKSNIFGHLNGHSLPRISLMTIRVSTVTYVSVVWTLFVSSWSSHFWKHELVKPQLNKNCPKIKVKTLTSVSTATVWKCVNMMQHRLENINPDSPICSNGLNWSLSCALKEMYLSLNENQWISRSWQELLPPLWQDSFESVTDKMTINTSAYLMVLEKQMVWLWG